MQATTKDRVLELLSASCDGFVSGAQIARDLGISRNSVWKAITVLRKEGFQIESVTRRGYRLAAASRSFNAAGITHLLDDPRIRVEFFDCVSSTNTVAKQRAETGAPEGTLIVANAQSAGRGRQGRAFASPQGTGVYFTLVLRPELSPSDVSLVTSYAACCLAATIDECTGKHAQIKWVNDVFVGGQKVSGILSEASFDAETQTLAYAVVGIGVNVMEPPGGFGDANGIAGALISQEELERIARAEGSAASMGTTADGSALDALRCRIVAGTVNRFMRDYGRIALMPHLADYRTRSILDGRRVTVHTSNEVFEALVLGINDDFTLRVQLDSGEKRDLMSGEVHIPSSQLAM